MTMRRNAFSFRNSFSSRWRSLYSHQSHFLSNFAPFLDGLSVPLRAIYLVSQFLTIISPVRKYLASFYVPYLFQNRNGAGDIIPLALTYHKVNWIAIGICYCMDLGTGSASVTADFIWCPPLFSPALCWCAWAMEPSKEISSSSASRLKTQKILSRMPSSIHLQRQL